MRQIETPDVNALWEALLTSLRDAVLVVDLEGRIVMANAQAGRTFGFECHELPGMKLETLVPGHRREELERSRRDASAGPAPSEITKGLESKGRRKDGLEVPVDVVVASVATAHGPVALAVIHDATRRVSGDDLLRQAREQLEGIAAERGSRLTDEGRRADGERSRLAQVQDLVSQIAAWTDQADSSRGSLHLVQPLASAVRAFERSQLLNALSSTGGRKARAAEILGISRKNLWEKLRAHGLGSSVDES